MIDEISRIIIDKVESIFSTGIGVMVMLIFGSKVTATILPDQMSFMFAFFIEAISKCAITIFSGVMTYLAIYYTKKLLKHETK